MARFACVALLLVSFAGVLGCGKSGPPLPKTVKVSGIVNFKGQPLADADVGFVPRTPEGSPANGRTDSAGRFVLTTYVSGTTSAPGAKPGSYTVIVSKVKPGSVNGAAMTPPKSEIPENYNDPMKSGLTAAVTDSGASDLKFDLAE